MKNDFARKFWIALCRNTGEGGSGGASGDGGQAGADSVGGSGGDTVAGGDNPDPSLLSEAALAAKGQDTVAGGADTLAGADTTKGADDGTKVDPPAAFDAAALTLPEGITLDDEVSKSFAEVLGDEKLTPQERGQKLVDLHLSTVEKITAEVTEQSKQAGLTAFKDMNSEWRKQTAALPEFKSNPEAEIGNVLQACVAVGAGEEFFKAVDLTGAGNHPAILQVLHRLVQPFLEGGSVNGDGKKETKRELGSNIYKSATPS